MQFTCDERLPNNSRAVFVERLLVTQNVLVGITGKAAQVRKVSNLLLAGTVHRDAGHWISHITSSRVLGAAVGRAGAVASHWVGRLQVPAAV
jgi:hypothetical protein